MSLQTEFSISPVLLQAITHTLTRKRSPSTGKRKIINSTHFDKKNDNNFAKMDIGHAQKVVTHLLHNMNEPVSALLSKDCDNPTSLHIDQSNAQIHKPDGSGDSTDIDYLRQRLAKNQACEEISDERINATENSEQIVISDSDVSMVNVLTAIASHHLKSSGNDVGMPVQLMPESVVKVSEHNVMDSNQPQYVICYDEDNGHIPSPVTKEIVVSQDDNQISSDYGNMQKIYVNFNGDQHLDGVSPEKKPRTDFNSSVSEGNFTFTTETSSNNMVNVVLNGDSASVLEIQSEPSKEEQSAQALDIGSPCPICGDKVSGYHYGIFSCESCKGFFKRTVQNKKEFNCLRSRNCEVNITNRKKCPACRFEKCLVNGMKLEAIRSDRTRGGRSYYDGCSPHGKSKPTQNPVSVSYNNIPMIQYNHPATVSDVSGHLGSTSSSQLVSILNRPSQSTEEEESPIKPYVPQVLTDIMNLESFLSDEDLSQEMGQEKISEEDMYSSLMQLTELRLYKLVRWARNLPQFSAIATDDQILLLQHCWSDLLVLGVCWPSISSSNELRLAFGKSIDRERAIAMDIEDMFDRMMSLTSQLRRLQVDNYEFVTLKVLILISPDVKGLKDPDKIRDQQDKICDALHVYTASHYPKQPNKFGEMLLRLPEVSRCSIIGKEYLSSRQITGDLPSCSLLLELIRGENEVKDL